MALTTNQEAKAAAFVDAFADTTAITNFASVSALLAQKADFALQIANQRAAMVAAQAAAQATLDGLLTQAGNVEAAIITAQAG